MSGRNRRRWWPGACLVAAALAIGLSVWRSWKVLEAYRAEAQILVASLEIPQSVPNRGMLQSNPRPPAQLDDDLQLCARQWDHLSQSYSPLCKGLPSYRLLHSALRDYESGSHEFQLALSQRRTALPQFVDGLPLVSPEADRAYEKVMKDARRQARSLLQEVNGKAEKVLKRAQQAQTEVEAAQHRVLAASNRVELARRNESKVEYEGVSPAEVFSADFNANRNPIQAMNALYKEETDCSTLQQTAERLQDEAVQAQAAQRVALEAVAEWLKESEARARLARQKVLDKLAEARRSAQKAELNQAYQQWYRKVESERLAQWTQAAEHIDAARTALAQEGILDMLWTHSPPGNNPQTPITDH